MNCSKCNSEVIVRGKTTQHYKLVNSNLYAHKYNIPFYCPICGAIDFSHKATRGVVFMWPLYEHATEYFNDNDSLILIPEQCKNDELLDYGIILSHGPGVYDMKKKGKWRPATGLSVGMRVIYDTTTPWGFDIKGTDGKYYFIKICDFTDIMAEVID